MILSGSSHRRLAAAVAGELGLDPGRCIVDRFPDGECRIELLEDVRAREVYLLQATHAPVGERLLEMLLLADACRRAGAVSITAVIPYLGYARQDRRSRGREPLSTRVIADQVEAGGIDRVVTVDLHSPPSEGCWRVPLFHLTALPLLAPYLRRSVTADAVVVAPDLGAMKRAELLARLLELPVAAVHKRRLDGAEVVGTGVLGMVRGLSPILVDDVIATGATIEEAVRLLREAGCARDITVVVTHAVLAGPALDRLARLSLARLVCTDSIPPRVAQALPIEVVSLAPLLAEEIRTQAGIPRSAIADVVARVRETVAPLSATIDHGDVVLEGQVPDVSAKKRALEEAAAIPGVVRIVDRVRLTANQRVPDEELRKLVGEAIQGDDSLRGLPIDVRVQDGVVTLDGDVPTPAAKRLAGVAAWRVPAVRDVVNGLGVGADADIDATLASDLRQVLSHDPLVSPVADRIRVSARKAVVFLAGEVDEPSQREAAERDAWTTFGVDQVESLLEIRAAPSSRSAPGPSRA